MVAVLKKHSAKASRNLALYMAQTPLISQLECRSSFSCNGMFASTANQQAGQDVLLSQAPVPPPPGLEQFRPRVMLEARLWPGETTKAEMLGDVSPCKSPMNISLSAESLDCMSTSADSGAEGWSSFSSQHTDLGLDVLPDME